MKITSVNNPLIKELALLKKSKYKKEMNLFLSDDLDLIILAKQHHLLEKFLYCENNELDFDGDNYFVTREIIDKLSPSTSGKNYLGVIKYPHYQQLKGNKIVYLDNVQDPGNVGTIIRTALAFSYDAVILNHNSANYYNDKVISASKGALFSIPIYLSYPLEKLKKDGYYIVGSGLHNAVSLKKAKINRPFALILGNEGKGMSEESYSLSDVVVKIEMDNIDSLNVGIAGGILMYEFKD